MGRSETQTLAEKLTNDLSWALRKNKGVADATGNIEAALTAARREGIEAAAKRHDEQAAELPSDHLARALHEHYAEIIRTLP